MNQEQKTVFTERDIRDLFETDLNLEREIVDLLEADKLLEIGMLFKSKLEAMEFELSGVNLSQHDTICTKCNGSGEGADFSPTCRNCGGSGNERPDE